MGLISNGSTIFDNGSMASGFGGNLIFISKATASASASIEFTSGIDSTYKEYVFYFVNIHPASGSIFQFNMSTDGGSTYAVTKTTTIFNAIHNESDTAAQLTYRSGSDLAQSTAFQDLRSGNTGSGADECISGFLTLFNPASTTYVKHFISRSNNLENAYSADSYVAGYGNTTSAVNAVQFKMYSGNIDSGTIKMYGVK